MGDTRSAKRAVVDVTRDLSRVVRGWPSEELIDTRVADITPVSSGRNQYLARYWVVYAAELTAKEQPAHASAQRQ